MGLNLGELSVRITANLTEFQQAFAQAQKTITGATGTMQKSVAGFGQTASGLLVPTSALGANIGQIGKAATATAKSMQQVGNATAQAGNHIHNTNQKLKQMKHNMGETQQMLEILFGGMALTGMFTVSLVAAFKNAATATIGFEDAFTGIRKTMDASEVEFKIIEKRIRDMSLQMPISAARLAKIGEIAGQLGVRGVDDITKFTAVVAQLAATTNLSEEDAAFTLARIATIMQTPIQDVDRIASAITGLGNTFPAVESEIAEFALRIAGAGKQVGLTEAQVLAFATALPAVGIQAEAGGTAISKTFIALNKAVALSGDDLKLFARLAQMSTEEFAKAFKDDAAMATLTFIESLGKLKPASGEAFLVLEKLGMDEDRLTRALLSAAGAGDLLRRTLAASKKDYEENIALQKEVAKRFGTTTSQIQTLQNNWDELLRTLGERGVPRLSELIAQTKDMIVAFKELSPFVQNATLVVAGLLAALGPVLVLGYSIKVAYGAVAIAFAFLSTVAIPTLAAALMALVSTPLGALAIALGIIIMTTLDLIEHWDEVRADTEKLGKSWENLKDTGLNVWGSLKIKVLETVQSILKGLRSLATWVGMGSIFDKQINELQGVINAERRLTADRTVNQKERIRLEEDYQRLLAKTADMAGKVMAEPEDLSLVPGPLPMTAKPGGTEDFDLTTDKMITEAEKFEHLARRLASAFETYTISLGDTAKGVQFLAEKKASLQNRLYLVQAQIGALSTEYEAATQKSGEFAEDTIKLADALDNARKESATLNRELKDTEESLRKAKSGIDQIPEVLKFLDRGIKMTAHNLEIFKSLSGEAGKSAAGLAKHQDLLNKKVSLTRSKVGFLNHALAMATKVTGEFSEESVALAEELDATEQALASMEAELLSITIAMTEFQDPIRGAKIELEAANKEIERTEKTVKALEDQLNDAKSELETTNTQISKIKDSSEKAEDGLRSMLAIMEKRIEAVGDQINQLESSSQDAERAVSDAFSVMADRAGDLEKEIDDAKRAMMDLTKVRFVGETAFEDAVFQLDQQERLIRLAINEMKRTGFKNMQVPLYELERQLTQIDLKREQLVLEREIQTEPLRRELERLADETKELTFEEARRQMLAYQAKIVDLTGKHEAMTSRIEELRTAVGTLVPGVAKSTTTFDEAALSVGVHLRQLELNAQEIARLTDLQARMRGDLDIFIASLVGLVPGIGDTGESFDQAMKAAVAFADTIRENNIRLIQSGLLAKHDLLAERVTTLTGKLDDQRSALDRLMERQELATSALEALRQGALHAAAVLSSIQAGIPTAPPRPSSSLTPVSGGTPVPTVLTDVTSKLTPAQIAAVEAQRRAAEATARARESSNLTELLRQGKITPQPLFPIGPGGITPFAEGGIVRRPVLGMLGEAGSEAVLPLSRLGGLMGGLTRRISGLGNGYMPMAGELAAGGEMIISATIPLSVFIGDTKVEDVVVKSMVVAERRGRVKAGTMR